MNKKFLVLLATCAIAATSLPLTGCAASRNQSAALLPVTGRTVIAATLENEEKPVETTKNFVTGINLAGAGTAAPDLPAAGNPVSLALASSKTKKNTKKNVIRKTERPSSSKITIETIRNKTKKTNGLVKITPKKDTPASETKNTNPVSQDKDNNKPETQKETVINGYGPSKSNDLRIMNKSILESKKASVRKAVEEAVKRAKIEKVEKASIKKAKEDALKIAKTEASKKASSEKAAKEAAEVGAEMKAAEKKAAEKKAAAKKAEAKKEAQKKAEAKKAAKKAAQKKAAEKKAAAKKAAKKAAEKKAAAKKASKKHSSSKKHTSSKKYSVKKTSSKKNSSKMKGYKKLSSMFKKNNSKKTSHKKVTKNNLFTFG